MKQYAVILLSIFFLTNCATASFKSNVFRNKENIAKAQSIPALKIPPGMNSDQFSNLYPIAEHTDAEKITNVAIEPPGLIIQK